MLDWPMSLMEGTAGCYEKKLALGQQIDLSVNGERPLGGHLRHMVSGSAALQPRLTKIFTAAGMQHSGRLRTNRDLTR